MIIDLLAEFDNTSTFPIAGLSANATSTLCTNSYDTIAAGVPNALAADGLTIGGPLLHDIGRGRPVALLAQVTTSFTGSTGSSLEIDVISATNGALTGTPTVLQRSAAVAVASLVAPSATVGAAGGNAYRFNIKTLPAKILQEFIGVQYVCLGSFSVGTLEVALVFNSPDDHADIFGGS